MEHYQLFLLLSARYDLPMSGPCLERVQRFGLHHGMNVHFQKQLRFCLTSEVSVPRYKRWN